ncbi:hypothetical protein M409DRAFT_71430 [Zasmidium cellare ATCC 36951]|uniref:Uncharacterized protein n=1 Tax=Zasmidium cellare ATCC 36951 TaxID=1080233 RepID=A0A6A6BZM1_ZASCE|nr:uncharacterized protein M409DRAFT_71430 [Zasmidium cellare ATCC 36951]KAF2158886.1 hypothetical protein M409DRAFT_71430 [Zasmidium cellare ATCC 36951]
MRDRRNTNLSVSSTDSSTSTTSRSSRNSLNEKRHSSPPPPSPTLPAPVTKENRPRSLSPKVMAMRTVAVICVVLLLWRCMLGWLMVPSILSGSIGEGVDESTELVAGNDLPSEPTAFMVDVGGSSKWTVSIPHNHSFPLEPKTYRDICSHGMGLQATLTPKNRYHHTKHWLRKGAGDYYTKDDTFLDIDDAENAGILPKRKREKLSNVCPTSLTFVLESDEASFGKTLLHLWMSYGLAKHEGRAFFIDDSRWAWGKYASYFAKPPKPKCSPPPAHHIVPCPHSAKHIIVSAATAPWTFGPLFHREFFQSRKHPRIYDLLRTGYENLFTLIGEDSLYAAARIAKLKEDAAMNDNMILGMQIRRGDLHPLEFQYSRDYLPLSRYGEGALTLLNTHHHATTKDITKSSIILASDDPVIINSPELQQSASGLTIQRAQERIQLATKTTLDQQNPVEDLREPGSAYVKHIDENSGWEGGFYSALFLSLGGARRTHEGEISPQALRLRELVGRAYLLDLAVLGESDGVVCAVSSATCRVLGVMLGQDALKERRWMNVDDGRAWSWDGRK